MATKGERTFKARETFDKGFDVVVAGAGVAGAAAATAAARAGARTALIEKSVLPGGLATCGLIDVYLPLCDGRGNQVTTGLAEEFLFAAVRYCPDDLPACWKKSAAGETVADVAPAATERFRTRFSPAAFALALDELLLGAGVDVWFDTVVLGPVMDGARVIGLEVFNKSGKGRLYARCVVDATGDADVAFRAGAPCGEQDNWLTIWAIEASIDAAAEAVSANDGRLLIRRLALGGAANGYGQPPGAPKFCGTRGRAVSEFVIEGRGLLRAHYKAAFERGETRNMRFPAALPAMAQFRTTRRICGRAQVREEHVGAHRADSVGVVADWRRPGRIWEIPYGALAPEGVDGLLAAGRCIDSAGDAWEVTRVIPAAVLTGQAAGTAAALCAESDILPAELHVRRLQRNLAAAGVRLHMPGPSSSAR